MDINKPTLVVACSNCKHINQFTAEELMFLLSTKLTEDKYNNIIYYWRVVSFCVQCHAACLVKKYDANGIGG